MALSNAQGGHGLQLTYSPDKDPSYFFECGDQISVTERGVTELLDIRTNSKVGDEAGSAMTAGASFMALYLGKGQPDLVPAEASPNDTRGWDLTIRIPKTD